MKHIGKSGQMIAAAAFALAVSGLAVPLTSSAANGKVQCAGVNSCKGHSACKTAKSACAGQNACKGQGWLSLTKAECKAKGGKILGS